MTKLFALKLLIIMTDLIWFVWGYKIDLEGLLDFIEGKEVYAEFSYRQGGILIVGEFIMGELREGQQIPLSVKLKTRSGNDATYEEGSGRWSSSNPSYAEVIQDPSDPLKAIVYGRDGSANATAVIEFRADGDPDSGEDQVRPIVATLDVTVTQGEAFVAEIEAGEATDTEVEQPADDEAPADQPAGGTEPTDVEAPPAETGAGNDDTSHEATPVE